MDAKMDTREPSYTGDDVNTDTKYTGKSIAYGLGFYLILLLLLIFTLCYTSYILKHTMIGSPLHASSVDYRLFRSSQGPRQHLLSTLPTFLYPEAVTTHNDNTDEHANNGSGCSICLSDYRPAEALRLLPECGHLFHVNCIDTWLKVHPTCPVCRNLLHFTDE